MAVNHSQATLLWKTMRKYNAALSGNWKKNLRLKVMVKTGI